MMPSPRARGHGAPSLPPRVAPGPAPLVSALGCRWPRGRVASWRGTRCSNGSSTSGWGRPWSPSASPSTGWRRRSLARLSRTRRFVDPGAGSPPLAAAAGSLAPKRQACEEAGRPREAPSDALSSRARSASASAVGPPEDVPRAEGLEQLADEEGGEPRPVAHHLRQVAGAHVRAQREEGEVGEPLVAVDERG